MKLPYKFSFYYYYLNQKLTFFFFFQGCSKKFAQSTNLKSHILTHAKQKGVNNGNMLATSPTQHIVNNGLGGRTASIPSPETVSMTDNLLQPQFVHVEVNNDNPDEQFIVYTE